MRSWKQNDVVVMVDEFDEDNIKFWVTLDVAPHIATLHCMSGLDQSVYLTVVGYLTEICFPVLIHESPLQEEVLADE